jgi:naphthalene 1,2-dioxygenase system ferredoxin subunit
LENCLLSVAQQLEQGSFMDTISNKWIKAGSASDFKDDEIRTISFGELEIAVYSLGEGEFRATDNICTHEYARLSEGWLESGVIECPLHAGQFDIRTGKGLCPPIEKDLRTFEVKVSEGEVLILVSNREEQ